MPKNTPGSNSQHSATEFYFRGGSNVLKPNHITSYIYPSLCGHPKHSFRLQPPADSKKRSRPQGQGSWGKDGHKFLTITRAIKSAPTETQFRRWVLAAKEKDKKSKNPLGRAMKRVTAYAGNTVLESGKFALRKDKPLVYVVKRTTMLILGGIDQGKFGRDEDTYVIECGRWRHLRVDSSPGHDSWWMRLHDLYQGTSDRAFWSCRENLDKLGIPAPLIKWLPRRDVESSVKIHRKRTQLPESADDSCTCGSTWFEFSEYACELKCGHFLCLECLTKIVDEKTGKGKLFPGEKDPNTKFWRCPFCRAINPTKFDRTEVIRPDELHWWRWRICQRRLEVEVKDNWVTRLETLVVDRWVEAFPDHLDHNQIENYVKVNVRYNEAVMFMGAVPKKVWSMLPFGFSLDNPVASREAVLLEECLQKELRRLSTDRRKFNTLQLIEHMKGIATKAYKAVIVDDKDARLGNPVSPPGYEEYRDFLCEWTARGCFLSPNGRSELLKFMKKMEATKTRAWWKDVRECQFDP